MIIEQQTGDRSKVVISNHAEVLSNGLGAQSIVLLLLACKKKIPARLSITAQTGDETDRLWSNGRRSTNSEYFSEVVIPLCERYGLPAMLVRATGKDNQPMPDLQEHTLIQIERGKSGNVKIPLFGSQGGRLGQSCTDRWKIRALNQTVRQYLKAKTARFAQGIHAGEAKRRLKNVIEAMLFLDMQPQVIDGFKTYPIVERIERKGRIIRNVKLRKWAKAYYPLIDKRLDRESCQAICDSEGVPFLISSECDKCPHQDIDRWDRHTPESIEETAILESKFNGEFFFTDLRIPLKEALIIMRQRRDLKAAQGTLDFGCESGGVCGV